MHILAAYARHAYVLRFLSRLLATPFPKLRFQGTYTVVRFRFSLPTRTPQLNRRGGVDNFSQTMDLSNLITHSVIFYTVRTVTVTGSSPIYFGEALTQSRQTYAFIAQQRDLGFGHPLVRIQTLGKRFTTFFHHYRIGQMGCGKLSPLQASMVTASHHGLHFTGILFISVACRHSRISIQAKAARSFFYLRRGLVLTSMCAPI